MEHRQVRVVERPPDGIEVGVIDGDGLRQADGDRGDALQVAGPLDLGGRPPGSAPVTWSAAFNRSGSAAQYAAT